MKSKNLLIIILFAGALKAFFYSSIFPFFTNVDEFQHFDVVVKYSKSHHLFPQKQDYDQTSIRIRSLLYSNEFGSPNPTEEQLPAWFHDEKTREAIFLREESIWKNVKNYESQQPPVYYLFAGYYYRLLNLFQVSPVSKVYALRWLSILFFCGLILTAFYISKIMFTDQADPFHLLLPAMVLFIPQDSFFTIGNDALHPLLMSLCFLAFLKWKPDFFKEPIKMVSFALLCSICFLTKYSTVSVFGLFPMYFILSREPIKRRAVSMGIYSVVTGSCLVGWFLRNKILFGSLTADLAGADHWKLKPFFEWFRHPLFSLDGISFFVKRTFASFWRGEVIWHGAWIQSNWVDTAMILLTLVLGILGIARLIQKREYKTLSYLLVLIVGSIGFLMLCSIMFDFGDWFYPSRRRPFLVSGRLIMGMMIPLFILMIEGTFFLETKRKNIGLLIMISIFFVFSLIDIIMNWQVSMSPLNWFHL